MLLLADGNIPKWIWPPYSSCSQSTLPMPGATRRAASETTNMAAPMADSQHIASRIETRSVTMPALGLGVIQGERKEVTANPCAGNRDRAA